MGQSKRLRLSDVRDVFRLVGECRELGVDATLWRRHMLVELLRLTGAQIGMGGQAGFSQQRLQPAPSVALGWSGERERAIFVHYLRDGMQCEDPVIQALGPQLANLQSPMDQLTISRQQLVDDRRWRSSVAYGEYHRPSGVDEGMLSFLRLPSGELHVIALHRPPGIPPFGARQRRLLDVFHRELAPHLLTDLAPPGCDPISQLSPRLRQVLACLLEGDSEQQTALRLGLTRDTTHQYVKAIYCHLEVNTRGELMASFVRLPANALA